MKESHKKSKKIVDAIASMKVNGYTENGYIFAHVALQSDLKPFIDQTAKPAALTKYSNINFKRYCGCLLYTSRCV